MPVLNVTAYLKLLFSTEPLLFPCIYKGKAMTDNQLKKHINRATEHYLAEGIRLRAP